MFTRWAAAMAVALALSVPTAARAEILVTIDKSAQKMTVAVDGAQRHVWAVSTGRAGYGTPNGHFRPQRMARRYFSRQYYNSPMPHSIFFHKGYAIHGTTYIRRLGGTASHGCVRLHPANAAALFALVKQHGMGKTRIVVTGGNPAKIAEKRGATQVRASALPPLRRARYPDDGYDAPYRAYPSYGYPGPAYYGPF